VLFRTLWIFLGFFFPGVTASLQPSKKEGVIFDLSIRLAANGKIRKVKGDIYP
jgi:hypothetical protein